MDERLRLIGAIADAGVASIEVGSFVSPRAVPAMAGTDAVVAALQTPGPVHYTALIPEHERLRTGQGRRRPLRHHGALRQRGDGAKNVGMSMAQAEAATADILVAARADGSRSSPLFPLPSPVLRRRD